MPILTLQRWVNIAPMLIDLILSQYSSTNIAAGHALLALVPQPQDGAGGKNKEAHRPSARTVFDGASSCSVAG